MSEAKQMRAEIGVRNVKGREYFYPNNTTAKLFLQVQGVAKTLYPDTIQAMRELGYEVELQPITDTPKDKKAA